MLRCQRLIPRRLFHATRTPLSSVQPWTRSGLMRLRKGQLENLAREQKMSTSGTKSEIVERLLLQETPETRVFDAVSKQASHEKHEPGSKPTPLESLSEDISLQVAEETTRHAEHVNKELEAANWVEAFELKLGNSRIRSERKPSMFSSENKQDRPPRPAAQQPAQHEPKPRPPKDDEPVPDDVDKAWVQAFEQKAQNRELRSRVLGTDTLRASEYLEPSALDFIHEEPKEHTKEVKEKELNPQLQQSEGWSEKGKGNGSRNWMVNSLIGSGLMVWLVSGESGFQSLATLLTSSS